MTKFKIVTIGLIITLLSACNPLRPWPASLPKEMPEDAPDEYRLGWKDGCESGLATYGSDYYKTFYKFHYDHLLMSNNRMYSRIWQNAFKHCRSHVNRMLEEGLYSNEGWKGSGEDGIFSGGSLRDKLGSGVGQNIFPIFQPWSTPGWGDTALGNEGGQSDWLGRPDGDSRDWLGRTPANR